MARFTARIELNGPPNSRVYESVHEALFQAGYQRWILSEKGAYWKLPDGMYVGMSSRPTVTDELEAVKRIVRPIWANSEIIVFEYYDAAWNGLTRLTDDNHA